MPDLGAEHALWYGFVESLEQKQAKYGAGITVRSMSEFESALLDVSTRPVHVIRGIPEIPDIENLQNAIDDVMALGGEIRLLKDAAEIEMIEEACRVNSIGFNYAASRFRPGMTELDFSALHDFATARMGLREQGYLAIVGAGRHASCLHWYATSHVCVEGEVLLMDAGCENGMYTSDHTRVVPVGRRFTARQEQVYAVCVASNQAAIDACRPGVK